MKKSFLSLGLVMITLGWGQVFAQNDLQVFGFFQGTVNRLKGGYSAIATVPKAVFGTDKLTLSSHNDNYTSLSMQQLNLFFRKEMNDNFTAWVNFEIAGNYSSNNKWGTFSLEEAWVNYQLNDAFNLKMGISIPRFAYLNEIKNKMPLLPYITRPLVYETAATAIDATHFIPEKAFIQAYGYLPVGDITLDYSVFVGPSEKPYIDGSGKATGGTSVDTTNFKLFGGRVGIKSGNFRAGISATFDKDNQQSTIKQDVPRTRLAFDLGYTFMNFFLDGEYISVKLDPKNYVRDQNKQFYYATLGYNISDDLFAYGTYSYMEDNDHDVLKAGMKGIILGAGYKPTDALVLKAGYANYLAENSYQLVINPALPAVNTNVDLDIKVYQLAISVLF
jgi:hypothetical protein